MLDQTFAIASSGFASPSPFDLAKAEDAVARLDERLATSPIAAAFAARTHVHDAAAAVSLEGELVHIDDLVLHDAAADIRSPTHALIRAHAALRARRRIAAASPGWAASTSGLAQLRGLAPPDGAPEKPPKHEDPIQAEEDALAVELAALDALLARTSRILDGHPVAPPPDLVTLADKDRLEEWLGHLRSTEHKTPVLAAALAGAALDALAPLPNQAWLGRMLIADFLRAREKTRHHLPALNLGIKLATRERKRGRADRTALWIEAITAAAATGLNDHDRLINTYRGLQRKLVGRRSTSKLPALIELVMRAPVVSSQTIAADLKITPRAAQDLVAELGIRELTGRTRYRCWGVL